MLSLKDVSNNQLEKRSAQDKSGFFVTINIILITGNDWLVGCFESNGPMRQPRVIKIKCRFPQKCLYKLVVLRLTALLVNISVYFGPSARGRVGWLIVLGLTAL